MKRFACIVLSVLLTVAGAVRAQTAEPANVTPAQIAEGVRRGVEYLKKSQSAEGYWGTGTVSHGNELYSMVPGSLMAFRLGTTALCVMALREAGEHEAHDRGLHYLLTTDDAKRDDGSLLYNTWANTYVTQAMAEEMKHNSDPRLAEVARRNIKLLAEYATYEGGWNYYDFDAHSQAPSLGPTSFGTAAGLVALWEAEQAGLEMPKDLVGRSVRRLEEMRVSNESFLYGSDYKYVPRLPANMGRGAIGRTQPSNFAIRLIDPSKVNDDQIRAGLDGFFKFHVFLDMGRKRPYPHESWYQTSGYYYFFDHYYAARLAETLPAADQGKYRQLLANVIVPEEETDGSWWDYIMWDFQKPYGTAFAVMTLLRCK